MFWQAHTALAAVSTSCRNSSQGAHTSPKSINTGASHCLSLSASVPVFHACWFCSFCLGGWKTELHSCVIQCWTNGRTLERAKHTRISPHEISTMHSVCKWNSRPQNNSAPQRDAAQPGKLHCNHRSAAHRLTRHCVRPRRSLPLNYPILKPHNNTGFWTCWGGLLLTGTLQSLTVYSL